MKTPLHFITISFLFAAGILSAQNSPDAVGERIATVGPRFERPQPLAEGYDVRLDPVDSKSTPGVIESFNLITRYPDGREEIIWTAPATEPDALAGKEGASKPLRDLRILTAYASPEMTSAMLWKNGEDYWWVRWDAKKRELLPLIMRFSRGDSDRYYFLDANTVEVRARGNVRIFTLKVDRDGNLTKNGQPWDKNYTVYDGIREVAHVASEWGGGVKERKIGVAWPYHGKAANHPPDEKPEPLPSTNAVAPTPLPVATPAASQPPPATAAQTPAIPSEPRASVWPWVVGAVLALVLVGALALKRRV